MVIVIADLELAVDQISPPSPALICIPTGRPAVALLSIVSGMMEFGDQPAELALVRHGIARPDCPCLRSHARRRGLTLAVRGRYVPRLGLCGRINAIAASNNEAIMVTPYGGRRRLHGVPRVPAGMTSRSRRRAHTTTYRSRRQPFARDDQRPRPAYCAARTGPVCALLRP